MRSAPFDVRCALVALTLGALAVRPVSLGAQGVGLDIGTRGPAAALVTLDGKAANLSDYVGKTPVLFEFWATWCENCAQLEPAMKAAYQKYSKDIKIVAVAVSVNQSPALIKAFTAKHMLPMDVLFDRDGNATDVYDAPATSYIVVLDKSGKVVYTGVGGRQNIEAAIKKGLGQGGSR
jgi:peroxiredoxin